jgi:YVTN family beta-propeller protein
MVLGGCLAATIAAGSWALWGDDGTASQQLASSPSMSLSGDVATSAAATGGASSLTTITAPPSTASPPTAPPPTATPTTRPVPAPLADDGLSSADRRLAAAFLVEDPDLQPKSVVASGTGLFFAQNMMYRHNVAVFDRGGNKVAEIPDDVDLAAFGVADGPVAQGSPVEAAFTPDGAAVYVSNYKMYGDGFNPVADDNCDRGDWDDSYVYRISTATFQIDQVIRTGAVPKFLAVTPDGATVLVSNWCGFDVSVIDVATGTERARVDVGRHPRGIAITPDSSTAYVTVMGERSVAVIDVASATVVRRFDAGGSPRHAVLSRDAEHLYVSNNLEGVVRKFVAATGAEVDRVATGTQPRTMVLAEDGAALFVVNYQDGTLSKVRTSDMEVVQEVATGYHPVGVTYDPAVRQVWVANYAGSLSVFVDGPP